MKTNARLLVPTPAGPAMLSRSPATFAVTLVAPVIWVTSPRTSSATPAPSWSATSSMVCGPTPVVTMLPVLKTMLSPAS